MGIWTAMFVKFWTRRQRRVSFEWGVYGLEHATEQAVLAKRAREPGEAWVRAPKRDVPRKLTMRFT